MQQCRTVSRSGSEGCDCASRRVPRRLGGYRLHLSLRPCSCPLGLVGPFLHLYWHSSPRPRRDLVHMFCKQTLSRKIEIARERERESKARQAERNKRRGLDGESRKRRCEREGRAGTPRPLHCIQRAQCTLMTLPINLKRCTSNRRLTQMNGVCLR
jgi:hypothetical protein